MQKKQMIDYFGLTSGTLSNYDTGKQGEKRKLMFEVLKSLPIEYVKERAKLCSINIEDWDKKK